MQTEAYIAGKARRAGAWVILISCGSRHEELRSTTFYEPVQVEKLDAPDLVAKLPQIIYIDTLHDGFGPMNEIQPR